MADLHRYRVRVQFTRVVEMHALNDQHAKTLAIADTKLTEDCDVCIATQAVQTATNTGSEGGQPLHAYDVTVRARRNMVLEATDQHDARNWAQQDIALWNGTDIVYHQGVQMAQKTGRTE